ncbi:hypothetical protein DL98DRAFT_662205 [Cadophora sp. DSE1049]|nr:hypothetical protein DL98DRAFT_662205 [Cadophora sp. DSE1049]
MSSPNLPSSLTSTTVLAAPSSPAAPNKNTLRAYLTQNHLRLTALQRPSTGETVSQSFKNRESFRAWEGFNDAKITECFGRILDHSLTPKHRTLLSPPPDLLPEQLRVRCESTFQAIFNAHANHVINRALLVGFQVFKETSEQQSVQGEQNSLSRAAPKYLVLSMLGGYCQGTGNRLPDWSAMYRTNTNTNVDSELESSLAGSLLPGDTKYEVNSTVKIPLEMYAAMPQPTPTKYSRRGNNSLEPQAKPNRNEKQLMSWLNQAFDYAELLHVRYCYVITPFRFFLCRATLDPPASEIARRVTRSSTSNASTHLHPYPSNQRQRQRDDNNDRETPSPPPLSSAPPGSGDSEYKHTPHRGRHYACYEICELKLGQGENMDRDDMDQDEDTSDDEMDEETDDDEEATLDPYIGLWALHMLVAVGNSKPGSQLEYAAEEFSL